MIRLRMGMEEFDAILAEQMREHARTVRSKDRQTIAHGLALAAAKTSDPGVKAGLLAAEKTIRELPNR